MKRRILIALVIGTALGLSQAGLAGEKAAMKSAAAAAKEADAKRKVRGRLPKYYGKIGVDGAQKEKVYAIQAEYRAKLEALQKQIDELEAKQAAEMEAVLTPAQRKQLDELVAAAAKSRSAKTAAPSPEDGASK